MCIELVLLRAADRLHPWHPERDFEFTNCGDQAMNGFPEERNAAIAAARQRDHFERVHQKYAAHYYDKWSLLYRSEFILAPLFEGIDLEGRLVADLACGNGHNSLLLRSRFPTASTVGFDISPTACAAYEQVVGRPAYCVDLLDSEMRHSKFDAALVIGGLHHMVADISSALRTIHSMLRPGGILMMFEPNARFVLQWARDIWYQSDPMFDAQSEAALDHDTLLRATDGRFRCERLRYLGGPAFYLVLNSAVLRLPLRAKALLSRPLFVLERLHGRLRPRWCHSSFVARWIAQ